MIAPRSPLPPPATESPRSVELLSAGLKVQKGLNPIRPGVMAVSARIESGRLKVVAGACPKLLLEASLYRYPEGGLVNSTTAGLQPQADARTHCLGPEQVHPRDPQASTPPHPGGH